MDRERWQRIERLFHAASELAPERRAEFLHGATRCDASLEAEVAALLQADEAAAERLRRIVGRACLSYLRAHSSPGPG
jgi:hypothetical protein